LSISTIGIGDIDNSNYWKIPILPIMLISTIQLLISAIRIVDINKSCPLLISSIPIVDIDNTTINCWFWQFELSIQLVLLRFRISDIWNYGYQQCMYTVLISTIPIVNISHSWTQECQLPILTIDISDIDNTNTKTHLFSSSFP